MIRHVYEAVRAVVDTVHVSVRSDDQPVPLDVRRVVDQWANGGPLAGLHAGLAASPRPWVLAVACDMPHLTESALRRLLGHRVPEADAVVARTPDGRVHPLCACYHRRTLPIVERQLRDGVLALRAVLGALEHVRYVDLPAPPLRNVNERRDLDPDAE